MNLRVLFYFRQFFRWCLHVKCHNVSQGQYTYDVHKNCLFLKTPHRLVHLCPKFLHSFNLARPILKESPSPHHRTLQQTVEQQSDCASERTKSKQKQNQQFEKIYRSTFQQIENSFYNAYNVNLWEKSSAEVRLILIFFYLSQKITLSKIMTILRSTKHIITRIIVI